MRSRTMSYTRWVATAAVVAALGVPGLHAQQAPASGVRVIPIRGHLHVIQGAGANIVVSVGRDGVLLVDSGLAQNTEPVLAAIRQLQRELDLREPVLAFGAETRSSVATRNVEAPPKPIRYILNTHAHPENVGGNEKLRQAGRTFTGGNVAG